VFTMVFFSSGLFEPGSDDDKADGAAFEAAVAGSPGADRERVMRWVREEAFTVQGLRKQAGLPQTGTPGPDPGYSRDERTAADKSAFYRYLHSRPQPW
jgi:hypothetical protein